MSAGVQTDGTAAAMASAGPFRNRRKINAAILVPLSPGVNGNKGDREHTSISSFALELWNFKTAEREFPF
jgi:hypothetical protein